MLSIDGVKIGDPQSLLSESPRWFELQGTYFLEPEMPKPDVFFVSSSVTIKEQQVAQIWGRRLERNGYQLFEVGDNWKVAFEALCVATPDDFDSHKQLTSFSLPKLGLSILFEKGRVQCISLKDVGYHLES